MIEPNLSFFDLPERKLAIYEWGNKSAENVIVCVHGLTRNARDFDFLANEFLNDYRVIAIDVAGRGKSSWIADKMQYHNFTYAQDIMLFLNSLTNKNIYWVGTSMGGLIGIIIASSPENKIKKIVINDIGPFLKGSSLKRIAEYTGTNIKLPSLEAAKNYFSGLYKPWSIKEQKHLDHMFTHSVKENNGAYEFTYDPGIGSIFRDESGNIKPLEDADLWMFWEQIKIPTLILRGSQSDLFDKEVADKMLATKSNAKLVEFEEAGHAPSLMETKHYEFIRSFFA